MMKSIHINASAQRSDLAAISGQGRTLSLDGLTLSVDTSSRDDQKALLSQIAQLKDSLSTDAGRVLALTTSDFDLFDLACPQRSDDDNTWLGAFQTLVSTAATFTPKPMVLVAAHERHEIGQPLSLPYEQAFCRAFAGLKQLADLAASFAVPLAIENPAGSLFLSPLELRDFVDEINSPYFGLCLNPANAQRLGNPNDWLTIFDRRIIALSLPLPTTADPIEQETYAPIISQLESFEREPLIIYRPA